jgi:hypothetical protein
MQCHRKPSTVALFDGALQRFAIPHTLRHAVAYRVDRKHALESRFELDVLVGAAPSRAGRVPFTLQRPR